jgi:hypothetical protein
LLGLLAGFDITLFDILKICVPATLIGVLVGAFFSKKVGKELVDDPEYQRRLQSGMLSDKHVKLNEVENKLKGTVASAYFTTPAYALGLVDNEVGFYTAKMTDGQWLNNGFKAYLPKPANAQGALRFNFGGETTAIESVLNGVGANAPIYDLSGRRVVNAVKGGIYIQNGKKFIVK